ncbi:branched-chain amino acid ABC transporter permease [Candidatus Formimonas warabiya]|uniref:Branched-chain amino acid ABC transporter permease n=1 Tax=Formimonas warabiya TaxID=1761012 RepID=A0A3G1KZC5_FORW1|nr:branched-chain amino acid ABC transporter permease [Candidatus Formimonas warabiya]ATW27758.1 hypothetical protein DCMF_26075 [Candidatus Formimonas warabiya]
MSGFLLFMVSILGLAMIYAVVALALNLEAGVDGLWDLGIVSFFGVGAYVYTIMTIGPPDAHQKYLFGFGLPIWAGVLAAGVMGALIAYLIGLPSLKLRNEYFLITTFAFAEVIRQVLTNEAWLTNGVAGIYRMPQPFKAYFAPSAYPYILLLILLTAVLVVYFIVQRLTASSFGRSLKALRENEALAMTAGISPYRFHIRSFVIAGFFAGVAGAFYVWYNTVVIPAQFSSDITFFAWMAIVIGGMGNNIGVIVGSIVFVLVGELMRFLHVSSDMAVRLASLKLAFIGMILIAILRWRPEGIFPERKAKF